MVLSEDEKRAIEKVPAANVQAYEYYLRGRQFFHQFRRTSIQFARRMFERANGNRSRATPSAYAGAADCCSVLYMYWDGSHANLESADAYSRKALELGPELAEAHASRGLALSLSKRYPEAEREFATAIRLNPKLFEAHYFFARALFQQGKYAEAVRAVRGGIAGAARGLPVEAAVCDGTPEPRPHGGRRGDHAKRRPGRGETSGTQSRRRPGLLSRCRRRSCNSASGTGHSNGPAGGWHWLRRIRRCSITSPACTPSVD